uniref:NAD(P)H-quinone oxidoreductase subunit H n=1 Tax=Pabstiella mirabilis TaxID=125501 RepID=A0A8F9RS92_9ASPA|nr:NAD(P)H-quinone oxidoreductase subunit H [Pabstiella mirabilis]
MTVPATRKKRFFNNSQYGTHQCMVFFG